MKQIFLLLFFVCIGCSHHRYQEKEDMLTDFLGNDDFLENYRAVIVIPVTGCGPCIRQMNAFAQVAYRNDKLLFIYCDVNGQRVQHLFQHNTKALEFLKIDATCELQSTGIVEAKPAVYYLKNGEISEYLTVDDHNSAQEIRKLQSMR